MEPKRYATAAAFRRALQDRLQDIAGKESVDLQRLRRQVAFDRLLVRLFQAVQPRALPWLLKGGYLAQNHADIFRELQALSASSSLEN